MSADTTPTTHAKASAFQVAKAVAWSFIGIRKRAGYEEDAAKITPVQLIVAGLVGAAIFVGSLVLLVTYLTAK
jgi:hypothetical protein